MKYKNIICLMIKKNRCINTVSYTHLDVYKRQVYGCCSHPFGYNEQGVFRCRAQADRLELVTTTLLWASHTSPSFDI